MKRYERQMVYICSNDFFLYMRSFEMFNLKSRKMKTSGETARMIVFFTLLALTTFIFIGVGSLVS